MIGKRIALIDYSTAESHRRFREDLVDYLPEYKYSETFIMTRPDMAKLIAFQVKDFKPDLIITTNGYNLSELRSVLPGIPVLLRFDENWLGLLNHLTVTDLSFRAVRGYQMDIDCIESADRILFNSEYQKLDMAHLLRDYALQSAGDVSMGTSELVETSVVIPRFVRPSNVQVSARPPGFVLWNHRWSPEKGTDELFQPDNLLCDANWNGRIYCTAPKPVWFESVSESKLGFTGWLNRTDHEVLLRQCSIILSTSHYETYGISVMEGILSGCHPVLPNRQVYPELIPTKHQADCLYTNLEQAATLLIEGPKIDLSQSQEMQRYQPESLIPQYRSLFKSLL